MIDQTQSTVFRFRCEPAIRHALEEMAHDQRISSSAYVRRAVARSLELDGAVIKPIVRPDETGVGLAPRPIDNADHVSSTKRGEALPGGFSPTTHSSETEKST